MAIGTRRHRLLTGEDVGSLVRWTVADATARLALSLSLDDNGCVARQTDDNSYHILAAFATPTWVQLGNVTTVTNSASAPTVGDDELDGYAIGALWVKTSATQTLYVCFDPTAGAAVWTTVAGGGGGGTWGSITGTLSSQTDLQSALDAKKPIELSGAGAPGVATGNGLALGTIYVDTTGDLAYTLVDATAGANVWASGAGGSGDVVGPASANDTAIARFNGTTGKLIKDGPGMLLSDDAHLVLLGSDPGIDIAERTTAPMFQLGRGHYWTKDDIPTTPWFTGDTNVSYQLADAAAVALNTAKVSYTDAGKVAGIETGADVTDTTNVEAAGALMDSEVDANLKTLTLPATTTISAFGATVIDDADAATARTTLGAARTPLSGAGVPGVATGNGYPIGTPYADTAAEEAYILTDNTAGVNIWSTATGAAGVDTTAIHKATAAEISALTHKTAPLAADHLLIEDSADSNNKKRITIGTLPRTFYQSFNVIAAAAANTTNFYGPTATSGTVGFPATLGWSFSWGNAATPVAVVNFAGYIVPFNCTLTRVEFWISPTNASLVENYTIWKIPYTDAATVGTLVQVGVTKSVSSPANGQAHDLSQNIASGNAFEAGDSFIMLRKNVSGPTTCIWRSTFVFTETV